LLVCLQDLKATRQSSWRVEGINFRLWRLIVPEEIIEARQVEKFYAQPHGGKVEVIAPTAHPG
jgi:hypothetical protein